MPDIRPFRGILYSRDVVKNISRVVSPPYDVLTENDVRHYLRKSRFNVVRLILNRGETLHGREVNGYDMARRYFENWRKDKVLLTDSKPALYLYEHNFVRDKKRYHRVGFISAVRIEEFGSKRVFPHERTFSGPIEDRLKLTIATRANLCPVFSLFSDADGDVMSSFTPVKDCKPILSARERDGVIHSLYRITSPSIVQKVSASIKERPFLIADGHHRYTSALRYRALMRSKSPGSINMPYDFVMMYLTPMESEGLVILPIHRLVRFNNVKGQKRILEKAQDYFEIKPVSSQRKAEEYLNDINRRECSFGVRFKNNKTYILILKDREAIRALNRSRFSDAKLFLDVTVFHMLFVREVLGIPEQEAEGFIRYSHNLKELERLAEDGWGDCIAILSPPAVEQISAVTANGERMPHKSTFFYPKLLSGMIFRSLDE